MGDRVRQLRLRHGLKAVDLARAIGIKQPSVFDIESGRTKTLRGNTLARLCEELRTTADFLLYGATGSVGIELATMEAELTYTVRALSPDRRVALIEYARFLMAQEPGKRPGPPGQAPPDSGESNIQPIRRKPKK